MPVLLYCVTPSENREPALPDGVSGAKVYALEDAGLRCFYSDWSPGDARQQALSFHRVVQAVFAVSPVLPFRFPSLVADESELRGVLTTRAPQQLKAFQTIGDGVQVEVAIRGGEPDAAATNGREYLLRRREVSTVRAILLQNVRKALGQSARRWVTRDRGPETRGFALVPRNEAQQVITQLKGLESEPGFQLIVSGPWPPTAFLASAPENTKSKR